MTDVGSARVEVEGDVRNFARQAERDIDTALSKIKVPPVKVSADTDGARRSGEQAGRSLGDGVARGAEGSQGRISAFLKKAFTPNPELFAALRAPFAAALSTPITAALVTVAGTAALAFVGAFAATLATAGLGAVFLGIGAAALFGAKQSRQEAQKDLDAAEERVRKAEQRAGSGTAAAKRSLADARAELAKAQEVVNNNAAFVKLDSSLSKLGDTLKRVGQSAAAPLMGPFTDALNGLEKAAVRIEPLLGNIFDQLAPAIEPLSEGMAGFVEEFLKVINEDPATLEAMREALIALGDNLPRIGNALGQFFALLASNDNNVRNMGLLFGLIESSIFQLGTALFVLGAILDGTIASWDAIGAAIGAAMDWITGTAIPAIGDAASAVGDFFQGIPGWISSAWSAVVSFFSGIISSVGSFISSVATSVVGFFTALPGRVMSVLTALPGQAAALFSTMLSNMAYIVGFGIGAVVGFFTALPGRVRSAISSIVSTVTSVFSSAKSSASSQATGLVNSAINIIKALPGKIRSALSAVRSAVTGAFSGAGSWLVSAGSSIISGIRNGIVNAIGGAVAAARNAAARIVQGFKDALKIGSPSKLMATEVGRWIPAGIGEGIADNVGLIDKQVKNMINRPIMTELPTFTMPAGNRSRGGDGASAGATASVTIQAGAIVIQGQGREAGEEAAEAVLERLGQATLAR